MSESRDTTPEAEQVEVELLRRMPVVRKLALLDGMVSFGRTLTMIGIRQSNPGLRLEELEAHYVRLVLGPELAERVFAARRARMDDSRERSRCGERTA